MYLIAGIIGYPFAINKVRTVPHTIYKINFKSIKI